MKASRVDFRPQRRVDYKTRNGKPHFTRHFAHEVRPGDLIMCRLVNGSLQPFQVDIVEEKVNFVHVQLAVRFEGTAKNILNHGREILPITRRVWLCKNVHIGERVT